MTEKELTESALIAIHNCRNTLPGQKDPALITHLLFPWVVSDANNTTGITISNTGADPFGTVGIAGGCAFSYYSQSAPPPQYSAVVRPGESITHVLSGTSARDLLDDRAAGFKGYMIVKCNFPYAHGVAFINQPTLNKTMSYIATRIKSDRSDG